MDIVSEDRRITDIIPIDPVWHSRLGSGFQRAKGNRVIDVEGMYVLPGLIDMHAHIPADGGRAGEQGFSYAYNLRLGHGVTTLRDAGDGAGIEKLGAATSCRIGRGGYSGPGPLRMVAQRLSAARARTNARRSAFSGTQVLRAADGIKSLEQLVHLTRAKP